MNIDGSCSVPKALETQAQSPSYALNDCQGNSQLVMDLSHITRNQSYISQFLESSEGNSIYSLC